MCFNFTFTKSVIGAIYTSIILLFLVLVCAGCSISKKQFSTDEPEIVELLSAIQHYQLAENEPPSNLSELVPEYLLAIPVPDSVNLIDYQVDEASKQWILIYYVKTGTVCETGSLSLGWKCSFPAIPTPYN